MEVRERARHVWMNCNRRIGTSMKRTKISLLLSTLGLAALDGVPLPSEVDDMIGTTKWDLRQILDDAHAGPIVDLPIGNGARADDQNEDD